MLPLDVNTMETKASYLGYELFAGNLNELTFKKQTVINTINQYSFCMAEKNLKFKQALQKSDILLPDGVGIVAAVKLQTNRSIHKISGSTMHAHLLSKLNQQGGRCFYLGSSTQTLQKIQQHLSTEYPNIKVGFYAPPFKNNFSAEDNTAMIKAANDFKTDVLFIGMTAPKQESWVAAHRSQLNAPVICSIGAVFDFYAGTVKRPSKIWVDLGLEWLGRLLSEPLRLWKRYLYFGPVFLFLLIKYKLHFKFF